MAKPSDFFVGVTDLFSIILPGSILTLIAVEMERGRGADLFGLRHSLGEKEIYLAFFVAAYVGGHVVDLLGALFLDGIYDRTYARWKRRPASGSGTVAARSGVGAEKKTNDPLFERAKAMCRGVMPEGDRVFQWCRAAIALRSPTAFLEIERQQATSKFFRSMVTVSLILSVLPMFLRGGYGFVPICLLFALAFFSRYAHLRWKAVQQTYRFYIGLRRGMKRGRRPRARVEEAEV